MKLEATLPSWATFVSLRQTSLGWMVELRSAEFKNVVRAGRGLTEDEAQALAEENLLVAIDAERSWREANARLSVEDVEDLL